MVIVTAGSGAPSYGTTYFYNDDGTPQCFVRANRNPPRTAVTDEVTQRYPTCFGRTFEANQEVLTVSAADALLPGSPQAGGYTRATRDGSGRVVKRVVSGGTAQSDAVEYAYDRLGRMARMYREDTSVLPPRAAVTVWHHDSLGQLVELDEQGNAPQFHSYDSAGNVTRVSWCDSTVSACAPGVRNRAVIRRYDGRGRLVHAEDQSGGVTVPGTPRDFTYDRAIATAAPAVSPTFVIGRLTQATAATSAVTLGYDGYGRVNTSVFTDLTTSANNVYVEKHEYHADGAPLATHLQLPDHAFQDERVDYAYDSAARMTGVSYTDGTTRSLFGATAGASIYDELGRVRAARFGATPYTATYNATGRQTLRELTAGVAGTADYRDVLFAPTPGTAGAIDPFDPVGRERVRQETIGSTVTTKTASYDGLGQLVSTSVRAGASWAPTRSFAYDGLGNLLSQTSGAAGDGTSTALSYQPALTGDLDRLCAVAYGGASPGACNVTHDDVGNVLTYPDAEGTQRTLTYFPGGQVHTIARGAVSATFDYDAFGGVQRLVVNSPNATEVRHDKHFGSFVEVRDESGAPVVVRTVAGPGGMLAKRHGASAASPWTFTFGEARGARFVTDQTGKVVQDVDYAAFGQASSTGASVGSQTYENHQWNDGDALTALGLSQLGARIYDPALGRFLSRDPLLDTGSARAANPYTFALNDPINFTDPTGLEANSIPTISISRMIAEVVVASGGGSSTGDNTDLLPMLACLNGVGVCPDGYGGDDGSGSGDGSSGGGSGGAVVHVTLGGNPGARGLSSGRDPWGPSHVPGAEALQGKRWLDRQVARALNAIREPIVAAAEDAGSVVASALGSTEAGIENYATNGYANASPYWAKQELEPGLRKIGAISGEIVFQVGLVVATEGFGWLRTIAGGGGGVVGGARQTLYHYTSEAGRSAILESGEILASQGAKNARHGVGQYFTDIAPEAIGGRIASATPPGKISLGQLSVRLFGVPWNTRKLASFLEIDVTGLGARLVAPNIWLRTGESSLEIVGRVCRSGSTLP
mgnify:CR=1 FL=1